MPVEYEADCCIRTGGHGAPLPQPFLISTQGYKGRALEFLSPSLVAARVSSAVKPGKRPFSPPLVRHSYPSVRRREKSALFSIRAEVPVAFRRPSDALAQLVTPRVSFEDATTPRPQDQEHQAHGRQGQEGDVQQAHKIIRKGIA